MKQILDRLSAMTGLPSPTMKVPHAVAMAFAFFDENFTGKLLGKEPRATVEAVRMGRKMMFASSAEQSATLASSCCRSIRRCGRRWMVPSAWLRACFAVVRGPMTMETLPAVIAALPREIAGLVRGFAPHAELKRQNIFVYRLPGMLVACAGMGPARATLAVQAAMRGRFGGVAH